MCHCPGPRDANPIREALQAAAPGENVLVAPVGLIGDAAAAMKRVAFSTSFGPVRFEPPPDGPGAAGVYKLFLDAALALCNHCELVQSIRAESDPETRTVMFRGWKRMFDEMWPDVQWKMRRAYITPESYHRTLSTILELVRAPMRAARE